MARRRGRTGRLDVRPVLTIGGSIPVGGGYLATRANGCCQRISTWAFCFANPLALLMPSVMMLNFLAETRQVPALAASPELIRKAYDACLISGAKTKDLSGELGTSEFADAVIARP